MPGSHPALYVSEQTWATAPDGKRIPASLVRRRDTPLPAPTLLYGHPRNPEFRSTHLPLPDRGSRTSRAAANWGGAGATQEGSDRR
ncbi:MAG: hypothetical protein AB1511_09120 [Deinococcota bacterium]